jgi:hypothetical protein
MAKLGSGDSDRLAYPKKDGLLLKNPLSVLQAKGTADEFAYFGGEYPVHVVKTRPRAVDMVYPGGHDMTMQFFAYYQQNVDSGYLWYTTMKR